MIVVCDLLCKSMSHEKVNSSFIYLLSLAFPDDVISFYVDATHIDAFLILCDKARYRLSCSRSMLESLSMMKPIVYF